MASRAKTFPICEHGGWKHTSAFHKTPTTNRNQTLENFGQDIGGKENGLQLATEEEGGPFGIGAILATLQQTGKLSIRRIRRNTTGR